VQDSTIYTQVGGGTEGSGCKVYAAVHDALEASARVVFLRAAGAGQRYVSHK
jgi:hypothetical protein